MFSRRGQNIIEYAILLCIIIASLLIMQFVIRRHYQGRLKAEVAGLGPVYSPRHTASLAVTTTSGGSVVYTGGETDEDDLAGVPNGVVVPDGMTVTYTRSANDTSKHERVDAFAADNN